MIKVQPHPDYSPEEGRYLRGNDFSLVQERAAMATVLLVDDDRNLRLLYEQELAAEGDRVIPAEPGQHAIAKIDAHIPDVVVIEVGGRVAGGLDLIEYLQKYRINVPIIANTTQTDHPDLVAGLVDAYIVKSSDLSLLKTKIRELLWWCGGRMKTMRTNARGQNIEFAGTGAY